MRFERVVVDASPLICLFRCGLQGLLAQLWNDVAVPEAVWQEVINGPPDDRATTGLVSAHWARRVSVAVVPPVVAGWDLGWGESEVLTFALQNAGYCAIVDDGEARRCARTLGIPRLGTGGVLVIAKRRGLIPSLSEALDDLLRSGLWLSGTIVALLKKQAGES
jgi:predicted nucleic acid-binding protein